MLKSLETISYSFLIQLYWLQIAIGNLDPNVMEEELKELFSQFGEIIYSKIPATKGYGFVQFRTRFVQCKICIAQLILSNEFGLFLSLPALFKTCVLHVNNIYVFN